MAWTKTKQTNKKKVLQLWINSPSLFICCTHPGNRQHRTSHRKKVLIVVVSVNEMHPVCPLSNSHKTKVSWCNLVLRRQQRINIYTFFFSLQGCILCCLIIALLRCFVSFSPVATCCPWGDFPLFVIFHKLWTIFFPFLIHRRVPVNPPQIVTAIKGYTDKLDLKGSTSHQTYQEILTFFHC